MTVDVIIRTLAEAKRRDSLLRAIASLTAEQDHPVRPIVVVNGNRADAALLAELRRIHQVCLIRIADQGLKPATEAGRSAVTAPAFAFLDDDDIYLAQGVTAMAAALAASPEADAVVTNGYRAGASGGHPVIADVGAVAAAPLLALRRACWLLACGTLFRTSSFPPSWFEEVPCASNYFEWTWIAYRAALTKRLHFSAACTYQINDTQQSMSKSLEMLIYEDEFMVRLQSLPLPESEREFLRRKHALALHTISDECRRRGRRGLAAAYHFRSLFKPGGCRYLPYTRHLLVGSR